jgi:hypothetical protein
MTEREHADHMYLTWHCCHAPVGLGFELFAPKFWVVMGALQRQPCDRAGRQMWQYYMRLQISPARLAGQPGTEGGPTLPSISVPTEQPQHILMEFLCP